MSLRKHLLLLALIPLCMFAVGASFYRFIVAGEYVIKYEGICDPATESCFVGCEDDGCSEIYYYTWIRTEATDVRELCGTDVSQCPDALVCRPTDKNCSVTYCSDETRSSEETCEDIEVSTLTEIINEDFSNYQASTSTEESATELP